MPRRENLLEFDSAVYGRIVAKTTVNPALFDHDSLVIEQDNLNTRDSKDDDDMVVLDVKSQRQLYQLLKEKFED